MGSEIDRLEIQVESQANKANQQLELLIGKLERVSKSLSAINSSGLSNMAAGVQNLSKAMQSMSGVKTTDFNRIANGIERLGKIDAGNLYKTSNAVRNFSNATVGLSTLDASVTEKLSGFISGIGKLGGKKISNALATIPFITSELPKLVSGINGAGEITFDTSKLLDFSKAVSKLGNKSVGNAITNMPNLANELKKFFSVMSTAPKVSENVIRMTQALGTLSNVSGRVNSASRSISDSLNNIGTSSQKANNKVSSFSNFFKNSLGTYGIYKGVAALKNFAANALEYGSSLTEVQNVVDVAFKNMSSSANEFANKSLEKFGLSELAAKKYSGTMMAMLNSSGVAQKKAAEMSTTLTGLAGDIASFYNITTDEAFTKIRSGISGETEPLKQLGINMNIANLNAYALANGISKTYYQMSLAEKTMLRYNYLLSVTGDIQGDFARTSGTWANQVKLLTTNFQALSGTIGQGLINVLLPVITLLNQLLSKLHTVANAFKAFTELLTGNKALGSSKGIIDETSSAFEDLGDAGNSAGNSAAGGLGSAGKAAKKLQEQLDLLSFDEINKLSDSGSSSGGGSGSGGGATGGGNVIGSPVDYGELAKGENELEKYSSILDKLIEKLKFLSELFKDGFEISFGDSGKRIDEIQEHLQGIGESLKEIFSDENVQTAVNDFVTSFSFNMGRQVGAFASIGVTIADNLVGGIDQYLTENTDYIKERIISVLDVGTEISELYGDFSNSIAEIFSSFANSDGKTITSSIIGIFSNAYLGVTDIASNLGKDAISLILEPIIENESAIKQSLENTLRPIAKMIKEIESIVTNSFSKIMEVYEQYVEPALNRISKAISTVFEGVLKGYNQYLVPVMDRIANEFGPLVEKYIQPAIDSFITLMGKAIDAVSRVWEFISPFVSWLGENFFNVIAQKVEWLWNRAEPIIMMISSVLKGVWDIMSGLIDFIVGVFSGDWEKSWSGIGEVFSGVWDGISGVLSGAWKLISNTVLGKMPFLKNLIGDDLDAIESNWSKKWENIKGKAKTVWDSTGKTIKEKISSIKSDIGNKLEDINDKWKDIWNDIDDFTGGSFSGIIETIQSIWDGIRGFIDDIIEKIQEFFSFEWLGEAGDWVKEKLGFDFDIGATLDIDDIKAKKKAEKFKKDTSNMKINSSLNLSTTSKDVQKSIDKKTKGAKVNVNAEANVSTKSKDLQASIDKLVDNFTLDVNAKATLSEMKDNIRNKVLGAFTARLDNKNDNIKSKTLTSFNARLDDRTDNIKSKTLTSFNARMDDKTDNIKNKTLAAFIARMDSKSDNLRDRWFNTKGAIFVDKSDRIPKTKKNISDVTANVTSLSKGKGLSLSFSGILSGFKNIVSILFKRDGGIYKGGHWQPITAYAGGGAPNMGQMFVAREAGPELVGRIGSSTAVMNNDQIVASVSAGVYRAVMAAFASYGNTGGNSTPVFNIYVGGKQVTDVVIEEVNNRTSATGTCPILI